MNVAVRHNGTDITDKVISYEREHKICTSIGTLEIVLDGNYSTAINPWDSFAIYENGSHKVTYYVSNVSNSVPEGVITVECQDKSKRLIDYFIPDTYTIDYPSYTGYWIAKFLTDAGISYSFTTGSPGNLLSNYTVLGLQSGYDQIMMLLQLSGWYMYFNGSGTAIIGTLDTDLATTVGTLRKNDILDIKRVTNDKMLRNRAVVWGQFDPLRQEYAYADVSTHTRWNYDHNDLRTMVISNNNIPTKTAAYEIANKLLKEFTKATIEKYITTPDAKNFTLGDAIRVESNIWKGKGLITTFGVSMSRGGLITNIVLDERCPRLFGFFNFGDYVYVSTFGDGVWRKHIRFDPAWYDFSSGLINLEITDLHINNGIFGNVSSDGIPYYANSELGPWNKITISSLDSSTEDTIPSGSTVTYQPYSGIMARATIVDKLTNNVKFGVDTWSGLNTGDYFMTYSGFINSSGLLYSGCRGWIVEYDPFTGQLVGGLGSGVYPISFSGSYEMIVLDLENDGINDYVSVIGSGDALEFIGNLYNLGSHITQPFISTRDKNEFPVTPKDPNYVNTVGDSISESLSIYNENALASADNGITDNRRVMTVGEDRKARVYTFHKTWNGASYDITSNYQESASASADLTGHYVLGIYPDWSAQRYNIFYYVDPAPGTTSQNYEFYSQVWDALGDTWESPILLGTENNEFVNGDMFNRISSVVVNNTIYMIRMYIDSDLAIGGFYRTAQILYIYIDKLEMWDGGVFSTRLLLKHVTDYFSDVGGSVYEYFPGVGHTTGSVGTERQIVTIFQNGEDQVKILGWIETWGSDNNNTPTPEHSMEFTITGDDNGISFLNIYEDTTYRYETGTAIYGSQLTINDALIGRSPAAGNDGFAFNGYVIVTFSYPLPYYFNFSKMYPVLNDKNKYIANDGTDFHLINSVALTEIDIITPPTAIDLRKPFSSSLHMYNDKVYFFCYNNSEFRYELIPYDLASFDLPNKIYPNALYEPADWFRSINFGNIFIVGPASYIAGGRQIVIFYIDLGTPYYGGGSYMLLQRDGQNFNLIQTASKPIRIDISNSSPVLSVQNSEDTFQSNYIYGNSLTQIAFSGGLVVNDVRDYRYTLLATQSGTGVSSQILYVRESGIFIADIATYSSGFPLLEEIPSGIAERIETSNYTYPGQYIFVTTSGDDPTFYQKDCDGLFFDEYSGLPSSRVTMIRLDDRF